MGEEEIRRGRKEDHKIFERGFVHGMYALCNINLGILRN